MWELGWVGAAGAREPRLVQGGWQELGVGGAVLLRHKFYLCGWSQGFSKHSFSPGVRPSRTPRTCLVQLMLTAHLTAATIPVVFEGAESTLG